MSMERGDQRASGGMLKPAAEDVGADENDQEGKVETQRMEWGTRSSSTRQRKRPRLELPKHQRIQQRQAQRQEAFPRKHTSKGRNTEGSKWAGRGKEGEPGAEEGQEVFNQLKRYLLQDAPQDYVIPVVNRLNALARERRFLAYKTSTTKTSTSPLTKKVLREQWQDVPTAEQNERYQNLRSYWDLSNSEHGGRLCQWIKWWLVQEDLQQDEVETRLQFCHFEGVHVTPAEVAKEGDGITSYLGAVSKGLEEQGRGIHTEEHKRMQILCTQPATSVT
ncbi:hypothetical protein PR003_g16357 [Phytophthora rubi]|uniref:Uncharacterized protein n=1 Tax=Phytophthora rubi TaxID=129364 RepID=A0A6A3L934_9STRA|nr:hypothetical protein PR001_g15677 [Phytophthora rubi]KAE9325930.1 hypothetical protein PR003_g16357 [Phytophthora rubi]